MNRHLMTLALAASIGLLGGCASTPAGSPVAAAPAAAPTAQDPATPAAAEPVVDERVSFFVHDARTGACDKVAAALDAGIPVNAVDAVDQTALMAAASKDQLACARLLLARGADPNSRDPAGWTPLIHATYFGSSLELISLLVERGADVNAQNDRGVTALYLAAAGGHEAYVRHLLSLGANPALATRSGYTPLRIAQTNGLTQIASLLEAGSATPRP